MGELIVAAGSAMWLGVLTSIHPCPLAGNIAGLSYVAGRGLGVRRVLLAGALYTLGRMAAYLVVGAAIVAGMLHVPVVAGFLRNYVNQLLGPILILVGMFLLELIRWRRPGAGAPHRSPRPSRGLWGAAPLGAALALSFCPISAALFFLVLIPLAVTHHSWLIIPVAYGAGTGLPVIVLAVLLAFGAKRLAVATVSLKRVESWARPATGVVLILVGIHYCVFYIFLA